MICIISVTKVEFFFDSPKLFSQKIVSSPLFNKTDSGSDMKMGMKQIKHYVLHLTLLGAVLAVIFLGGGLPGIRWQVVDQEGSIRVVEPLVLVFSGDVMQHLPQVNAARINDSTFDYSGCFGSISRLWRSADFAIVNLETTISSDGRYSGYPMFSSPEGVVSALADAGVSVAALANNHIMDKGGRGLTKTIETLDKYRVLHTGAYRDSLSSKEILYLVKPPYKVALLNYTYSTNGMPVARGMAVNGLDTVLIKSHLAQCRRDSATSVVVYYHFGQEYQRKPSKSQTQLARWTRQMGADLVVGSHPHVVQRVDTALRIAYSLGNLVSNQSLPHTDYGVSLRVEISEKGDMSLGVMPHWVDRLNKYRILLPCDTINHSSVEFKNAMSDAIAISECRIVEL